MHGQPSRLVALGGRSLQNNGERWFGLAAAPGNEQSDAEFCNCRDMDMQTDCIRRYCLSDRFSCRTGMPSMYHWRDHNSCASLHARQRTHLSLQLLPFLSGSPPSTWCGRQFKLSKKLVTSSDGRLGWQGFRLFSHDLSDSTAQSVSQFASPARFLTS